MTHGVKQRYGKFFCLKVFVHMCVCVHVPGTTEGCNTSRSIQVGWGKELFQAATHVNKGIG